MNKYCKPKIILTFDVEYWHDSDFLDDYINDKENLTENVEAELKAILALLEKYNIRATFFVLGKIAKKYPEIIKKISIKHEIASHGFSHRTIDSLDELEFEKEIIETNNALKEITGKSPMGFRAPAFSISRYNFWAFKILTKNGFYYDSSLSPRPFKRAWREDENDVPLKELPVAVFKKCFLKIPVSGGIYFRLMPYFIFKWLLRRCARTKIPVVYFHNHEMIAGNYILARCPAWKKILKFSGIKNNLNKFERLLNDFECISADQYLNINKL